MKAKPTMTMVGSENRAKFMLRVAAQYIRTFCPDETIHYDEADCDGYCVADDCESAGEELEDELESYQWKISPAMAQATIDQHVKRIEELERLAKVDQERTQELKLQISALERRAEDAEEDTRRLDFLELANRQGFSWIARNSVHGRGYRLHQDWSMRLDGMPTARGAIDLARTLSGKKTVQAAIPGIDAAKLDGVEM